MRYSPYIQCQKVPHNLLKLKHKGLAEYLQFKDELSKVIRVFDVLEEATNSFESQESCSPRNIAQTFSKIISKHSEDERESILSDLASTLFLVTGRSDNNFKCQFPLYLRDNLGLDSMPQVRGKKNKTITRKRLPRVLKKRRLHEADRKDRLRRT